MSNDNRPIFLRANRMNMHRQNGDVSDLRSDESPWTWGNLIGALLIVGGLSGIWSFAMDADFRDEQQVEAQARAEQERLATPAKVAEAYERGLVDAINAMRETPDGVALAQVCMAKGAGR